MSLPILNTFKLKRISMLTSNVYFHYKESLSSPLSLSFVFMFLELLTASVSDNLCDEESPHGLQCVRSSRGQMLLTQPTC